jgi:hypothetical protein
MTKPTDTTHDCPCGCGERIPRNKLACKAGWVRLPQPLRVEVTAAWRAIGEAADDEAERAARTQHTHLVRRSLTWFRNHPEGGGHGSEVDS